jgi:hypothetical protein
LIEQVQHTGSDSVTSGATKQVRLSYNHPVKELVWCLNNGTAAGAKLWNFCSNSAATDVIIDLDPAADAANEGAVPISAIGTPLLQTKTGGSTHVFGEDASGAATTSCGPVKSLKLVLNGQDRFKEQSGKYFNQVQPYQHHSGSPMPGIYSYSFALKPEEHQPTGTCNFSRIDNAQVAVELKDLTGSDLATPSLDMFAVNYNVLRVQSGMGGLAFSN